MKAFTKLLFIDTKLFFRDAISAFFVLAFPLMMLVIFGAMFGNDPSPLFNGKGSMDVTVPGYIVSLVIGTTGFLSLPIALAIYRERGILRRFRVTPLGPGWVLGSQGLVNLAASLVGTLVLIIAGVLLYHLQLPANPLPVLAAFLLISIGTYAIGMIIASLVKNANTARAVSMVIYYPMMFLSGGTYPRELMPQTLKTISNIFPLTYGVDLMKSAWFGQGWDLTAVAVLAGCAIVGGVVCVALFRWE